MSHFIKLFKSLNFNRHSTKMFFSITKAVLLFSSQASSDDENNTNTFKAIQDNLLELAEQLYNINKTQQVWFFFISIADLEVQLV